MNAGTFQLNSTISDTLKSISDDKSLIMFNMIALSSETIDTLAEKSNLTRKQCYSRTSALTTAGLIKRANGGYYLTSFGKIVYEVQLLIAKAKQDFWKLNAIDSIESSLFDVTVEERRRIIDSLMVDDILKEILNKNNDGKEEIKQPFTNPTSD
jgi:predicted transcriptional regulator